MFPPFLPGYLIPAEIDLTLAFAPLMTGLMVMLIVIAFGLAAYVWGCYFIDAPIAKAVYPRRFVCPITHEMVEAKFVSWKGQPWDVLDVERCSGWCLGVEKNCNKECMRLFDGPVPTPLSLIV